MQLYINFQFKIVNAAETLLKINVSHARLRKYYRYFKDSYFLAIPGMQAQKISKNLYTDISLVYSAVYKFLA